MCLERCDARTLRELKAVSKAWRRRARQVLGVSTSVWRQQPIWSTSAAGMSWDWRGVELSGHADAIIAKLDHAESGVRRAALETLQAGAGAPPHAAAIVAKLDHPDRACAMRR